MKKIILIVLMFFSIVGLFGCESYSDILKFESLCGYSIDSDIVNKIVIDQGPGSIAPPWLHEVYEITDLGKIKAFVEFIDKVEFNLCVAPYDGVGYKNITIYTNEKEYNLIFSDKNEFYFKSKIYNSSIEVPDLDGKLIHYYYKSFSDLQLKSYNNIIPLPNHYFDDIYFTPYSIKPNRLYLTKFAVIVLNETQIMITSNNTFVVGDNNYAIVGEKDFSDILKDIDVSTSIINIVDINEMVISIIVSNNIDYTLEELKEAIGYNYYNFELEYEDGTKFIKEQVNNDITLKLIPIITD